jgi:hypothetical protein
MNKEEEEEEEKKKKHPNPALAFHSTRAYTYSLLPLFSLFLILLFILFHSLLTWDAMLHHADLALPAMCV